MSRTHTITPTWGAGGDLLSDVVTVTGGSEQNLSLALGVVTDELHEITFSSSNLQEIFIVADQDCTLEVNSGGSPTDTIALKANKPFSWYKDSGVPFPFTGTAGAVTKFYFTTTIATGVEVRSLIT